MGGARAFTLGAGGHLTCRSLPDGAVCWERLDEGQLLACSAGGEKLVVADRQGLRLLDVATGAVLEEHPLDFAPVALAFGAAAGPVVATRAGEVLVRVGGAWQQHRAFDTRVTALVLGEGDDLWVALEGGRVERWSEAGLVQRYRGAVGSVRALALGGGRLFAGGDDRLIHRWDLAGSEPAGSLAGHSRPVLGLGVDAEGSFWSGGRDQRLRGWEAGRTAPFPALAGHASGVRACRLRGDLGFTGGRDGGVLAWGLADGRCQQAWLRGPSGVTAMVLESVGGLVVGRSNGSLVGLAGPERIAWQQRRAHDGPVACLGLVEGLVISGGADGSLRIWDAGSGMPVSARLDHGSRLRCLALSAHGELVATGGYDGSLVIAPALGGDPVAQACEHEGPVVGCAWARERVATVGMDGVLRAWGVDGGLLGAAHAHDDGAVGVVAVAEQRVVTVGGDGRVCCFGLEGGEPVRLGSIDLGVPLDGLGCERLPEGGARLLVGDRLGGAHLLALAR